MPYIPPINITDRASSTVIDIPNAWRDYFRVGDEVAALDVSEIASSNLAFRGKSGVDVATMTLDTDSCDITAISDADGGTNGAGYTKITVGDAFHTSGPTEGVLGTGDILVLVGSSASAAIKAYQEADKVVIMEQEFTFKDSMTDTLGEGGYVVESAVYAYTGRIDSTYINYYTALNTFDSSPALTVCGQFVNYSRFNFEAIYRG
jgi:hypothetical protein